jgi:voltage-gated potassium channel
MTTVGYGDIAPSSFGGRLVAIFLMIIGIGFLSTLTGTISSFFIKNMDKPKNNNEHVNVIINQLSNFDDLTLEEIKEINAVLLSLKTVDKNKKI